ncbi:MAG: S1 RNA-binding domain-containing protein, partial [Waddliaceae bacterium]|nr:S1 RNA-binding domain-containing protein [Waddliaceae bacterium]
CPAYNKELSSYAPRIEIIEIPPKKIGTVIGPGGKQIRAIVEETGVEMNIDDDGKVSISSSDAAMMERAKEIVKGLIAEAEIGKTYEGLVKSTVDFGAFVEILPGKEGLCHISELDTSRVDKVTDIVKEGDTISVKVLDVDNRSGKIKLSRKALLK